jgi:hypothetical protein
MWEILVPTVRRIGGKPYTTRYHRVWDAKVRMISGGLTILTPAKGQWVAPDGELFIERMIPVRIMATNDQISAIIDMTMDYYDQLAILCYKVSDVVLLRKREDRKPKVHPCKKGCMRVEALHNEAAGVACLHGGCLFDKGLA